jgi:hypothetical protein
MSRSQTLSAVFVSILLLSAFSAQAAEGVEYVGKGVSRLMAPTKVELRQSKLLVSTSTIKHGEIEEPLGQGRRKDTTSAGISRAAGEPKQNTPEKSTPERTAQVAEKREQGKFGIYNAIKESVLDFFLPSRKEEAKKIDLSRVQKDGRTESQRPSPRTQPAVR